MKKSFIFLLFILSTTYAFSQTPEAEKKSEILDSLEVADAEEEMLYKEDTADYDLFYLPVDLEYIPGDDHPEVIADRVACISTNIPLTYNDKVHAFINYFTVRDREYTRMVMRRKNLYFPIFEKYLAKYGLPQELKYLSIIESGLNPRAISRARAVGLWQFMSATGRYYGLKHDWYIDERMDPEKATEAACRYLKDLYNIFNDWELALAAYNTGPGNVKKAIRRSGYKRTFWEIYPNLPRETRSYVPQFIAIVYTMSYLHEHNFIDEGSERYVRADTIQVNKFLNFETFASLTETCVEDLQRLNPFIIHNVVPQDGKTYTLRIPETSKGILNADRFAILDSASKVGRKEVELLAKAQSDNIFGRDRIVYKVRRGDVLGSIAMRHRVSVSDLKKWNKLRGTTIHVGQRLNIYPKGSPSRQSAVASAPKAPKTVASDGKTYTVQPGDTLWSITRKFEGLTVEKIKELNKLGNSAQIQPGQKLIIQL